MEQIGIRELRQHASRYLARVADGESLEVTDRGRPVARLVPVRPDPWDDLLASGQLRPPTEDGGLLAEEPADYGIDAGANVRRDRDTDR